jgi:hypothetical protein
MSNGLLTQTEETRVLAELNPIVEKWAKRLKVDPEIIERAVAYQWGSARREAKQSVRDWLSVST